MKERGQAPVTKALTVPVLGAAWQGLSVRRTVAFQTWGHS